MWKLFNTSFETSKEYSLWKAVMKQITKLKLKNFFYEEEELLNNKKQLWKIK